MTAITEYIHSDPSIDAAWADEIEKRIDAYDNGKISASPPQDVFDRINKNSRLTGIKKRQN